MRLTVFAATLAFLLWGTPAFAGTNPDFDADGVGDTIDNCSEVANAVQDDTDGDLCGNVCDADYDDSGVVAILDFGAFGTAFGTTDEEKIHQGIIPGSTVSILDFGVFGTLFNSVPGPSGTTTGTTACP